ncbi:CvpA family protein [Leeia sp. TBRC 13508]|uniref:CvpA family protein n=1 Tax=Leeia speluncae TaxID=2884804 RepID=A0ABS8DAM3_9NEIS|nr:CvpA family protein [Leeia speluncae]MCB6185259.1 CvpA family protein [Leeia speluncae]
MTSLDYLAIAVVSISVLLGVMRGFIKETLSLLTWFFAYFLAQTFYLDVVEWLPDDIPGIALKFLTAFLLVLLAGWLLMSLITIAVGEFVKQTGLTTLDRVFGVLFGLARGLFVLTVLTIMAGLTKIPQTAFWKESAISSPMEAVAVEVKPYLPQQLGALVKY